MTASAFPHVRLERPLVFLDLETTALSPSEARIVEVGVVKLLPDGQHLKYDSRVSPGIPIPRSASEVHGLRDRDVKGQPPFSRVGRYLAGLLRGADLAGYNLINFDLPVLVREFARIGITFSLEGRAIIDVFHLFRRQEPRDLAAALRFYLGCSHRTLHRAADDAWAAAQVFNAQLARYTELPATPSALHRLLVEVDIGRRFRRDTNGMVVMGFGKHAGVPLSEVAVRDRGYLEWLQRTDLLEDARALVQRVLEGLPPEPLQPSSSDGTPCGEE
jgi:DNA polymerase-3 subunit epsilon